jgi:uncharacterized protein (TIGR02284 family)
MATNNKQLIRTLSQLYRICDAGERGFLVVAENVKNRGLKLLLKTHAQERAQFKTELGQEIEHLGGQLKDRSSIFGIIHRGRIDILATLIIGPENVERYVLGEAMRGEKVAIKTYEKALRQNLPDEVRTLVQRQAERVQAVCEEIRHLRGQGETRLVIRLFNSEEEAKAVVQALQQVDVVQDNIEQIPLTNLTHLTTGKRNTVIETVISGAVGGAIWGGAFGIISGLGVLVLSDTLFFAGIEQQAAGALVAVLGVVSGAVLGLILGMFIGLGVSDQDVQLTADGLERGVILLKVRVDDERARHASQIVNAAVGQQPA